jgi:hypothetical protein
MSRVARRGFFFAPLLQVTFQRPAARQLPPRSQQTSGTAVIDSEIQIFRMRVAPASVPQESEEWKLNPKSRPPLFRAAAAAAGLPGEDSAPVMWGLSRHGGWRDDPSTQTSAIAAQPTTLTAAASTSDCVGNTVVAASELFTHAIVRWTKEKTDIFDEGLLILGMERQWMDGFVESDDAAARQDSVLIRPELPRKFISIDGSGIDGVRQGVVGLQSKFSFVPAACVNRVAPPDRVVAASPAVRPTLAAPMTTSSGARSRRQGVKSTVFSTAAHALAHHTTTATVATTAAATGTMVIGVAKTSAAPTLADARSKRKRAPEVSGPAAVGAAGSSRREAPRTTSGSYTTLMNILRPSSPTPTSVMSPSAVSEGIAPKVTTAAAAVRTESALVAALASPLTSTRLPRRAMAAVREEAPVVAMPASKATTRPASDRHLAAEPPAATTSHSRVAGGDGGSVPPLARGASANGHFDAHDLQIIQNLQVMALSIPSLPGTSPFGACFSSVLSVWRYDIMRRISFEKVRVLHFLFFASGI